MKRTRIGWTHWLVGGAVMALVLAPGVARADSIQVVLDGEPLAFDVPPVIEQNVTMVPVRAVLTPLGASLTWNPESQTVSATLNETTIEAVVGSETARVNGQAVRLAMPVLNREGRTLVPLRFFAEELGFAVNWEGESHTVRISSAATGVVASRESARTASVSREATRRVGELVLAGAQELVGLPYAWGGSSPETGFDCSGFIVYLGGQVGVDMVRTSFEQYTVGTAVERAELAAGDLVFFSTYAPGASHVGVYDGAGGFIHAQSPEVGVVRTALTNPWWAERYIGARRVFR